MWKKSTGNLLVAVCLLLLLGACGQDTAPDGQAGATKEAAPKDQIDRLSDAPITLKVWSGDNATEQKAMIAEPIKAKFPNITLEIIPSQGNALDKLLSQGTKPDIIRVSRNNMVTQVLPPKMEYDMSPLIKKYNYDLSRYSPELIQSIKGLGKDGQMLGLPYTKVTYGLLYNKQLFDKFAVPYPKDGMAWDQAIELAKRMTRLEDGVQYLGLCVQWYNILGSQLSLPQIDRNDKANMSNWTRPATIFKQIYDIPGNRGANTSSLAKAMDPFYKGTLAMLAINPSSMISTTKQYPDLQWDMVTVPTFPEAPKSAPFLNYRLAAVAPTSEHKEDAFKVIAYLNSDEVQTKLVRDGYVTSLNNPEIQKQFAANLPELKDKNLQAIFKNVQADPFQSQYLESSVEKIILGGFNDIREGKGGDINTVLRQMDEEINKKVAELKAGK
jgi:multiple sugar transport system substrate-binding protein